jgi:hypothetical protein
MLDGTPVAFSAKGGPNGEPHNQNDLGHFILHVGGESLLADLGAGVYTREYFGPRRYEHIHNSSEGHSVPLIDGQPQQAGRQYAAGVLQCDVQPDGLLFELDLKGAYAVGSLRRFVRSFTWVCSSTQSHAQLRLTDTFGFDAAPGALEEIFVSLHEPALALGRVTWAGARGAVTLSYDPQRFNAVAEALPSHTHHSQPIVVHRLRLAVEQPQVDEEFAFIFEVSVNEVQRLSSSMFA